ncbi:MAG: cytochrome c maturation protein CcmE [Chloroflexi bacterium]|nr:cytochrome c maturation protein CcmE [Chloroflexota bacterium]
MTQAASEWPTTAGSFAGVRHLRIWIAVAVALIGVAYLVTTSLQNNAVYYLTVGELRSAGAQLEGQPVRVAGNVVPGTIVREPGSFTVQFEIADESGRLPIVYKGVVPDIFGPNIEVVVEGKYDGPGTFTAATLLAKCPSKFESA